MLIKSAAHNSVRSRIEKARIIVRLCSIIVQYQLIIVAIQIAIARAKQIVGASAATKVIRASCVVRWLLLLLLARIGANGEAVHYVSRAACLAARVVVNAIAIAVMVEVIRLGSSGGCVSDGRIGLCGLCWHHQASYYLVTDAVASGGALFHVAGFL